MSKALPASCGAGLVKIGAVPLPNAVRFSKGIAPSQGIAFLDEDKQYYITNTQPDLETTLGKVSESLDKIAASLTKIGTILTSIGAGMTGPSTAPPPTLATDVADITANVTAINLLKAQLDTLKGNLI